MILTETITQTIPMKPEIKTITPEIAKKMLEKNSKNRQLSHTNVQKLAREIKAGRWRLNGDMIRISVDGDVLDGQHRLWAVVRSGMTIQTWVMYDVPGDVFDTIDVGKRRSAADTLSCMGEKHARDLAALLTLIERYMTGKALTGIEYNNSEMQVLLMKYPDARAHLVSDTSKARLLPPSVLNVCHYLFSKKDPVLAREFLEKIVTGTGLEKGDPWHALREKLLDNLVSTSKLPKAQIWACCVKAWNCAREGRRITRINLLREGANAEDFPEVE